MVEPGTLPDGREATTPVVPVIVGEDWQAVLLWKALFEAGVYTNVAIHPAVPPGGALLRTSLMATHERDQLDRALEIFAEVQEVSRTFRPGRRKVFRRRIGLKQALECNGDTISLAARPGPKQNICS